MRLSAKLTILFLLLAIIPLIIVGYFSYANGRRAIEQNVSNHLTSTNILKEAEINHWIENNEIVLRSLASRPLLREFASVLATQDPSSEAYRSAYRQLLEDHLLPTVKEETVFLNLSILRGEDGFILISTEKTLEGKYRESEQFFLQGKSRTFVENVNYSLTEGGLVMHVSAPILDAGGGPIAVLVGHADLAEISKIMGRRSSLSRTEDTYLVNTFNFFVTEPLFGEGYALKKAVHTEGVEACLEKQEGVAYYRNYRNEPVIGAYRWIPERELCILTEVDQTEAYAPIAALGRTILGIGLVVALGVALLGLLFARTITGPVRQLARGAEQIGRGNLEYRIPAASRDEIGQLSRTFNTMAGDLRAVTASRDELNREINERRLAEETLRQSEEKYRALFQNAQVGMYRSKLDGSAILAVNRKLCEIFEYSEDEMIGNPATIRWADPAARERMVANLRKTGALLNYEIDIQTKNGNIRTCSVSIQLNPEMGYIEGSAIDVTDRKRMERDLRESEEKYRLIADNADDWIYLTASDRKLLYTSPSCERVTGYSPAEFTADPDLLWKIVHPDDRGIIDQHQIEADGPAGSHSLEFRIIAKSGEFRWLNHSCTAVLDESGKPAGRRGTNRDITARKLAEEKLKNTLIDLERSNKELEQFAYVASHDLQEPLRMVSSYTQLLAKRYQGRLDKDADEFIAYAVDGAGNMQRLINDLLAYSRVGTRGKLPSTIPADAALDRALENLKLSIEESRAEISREPLPAVSADEIQLTQLFQNLIANAIKFRGENPPKIRISCEPRGKEWIFSVRDDGIGIDPQYFDRIFVIFQRLHPRAEYPGTGIGLAICKKIVQRHGGRIWVESEPGKGSAFYFSLPKIKEEDHDSE